MIAGLSALFTAVVLVPASPGVRTVRPGTAVSISRTKVCTMGKTDARLAELGIERAVICGHSYGTALVSYALNRDRGRRLCGTVLLDPIATLLHHSTTTREFVYRPISGLADAIADTAAEEAAKPAPDMATHDANGVDP